MNYQESFSGLTEITTFKTLINFGNNKFHGILKEFVQPQVAGTYKIC